MPDLVLSDPEFEQLTPADRPVLLASKRGQ